MMDECSHCGTPFEEGQFLYATTGAVFAGGTTGGGIQTDEEPFEKVLCGDCYRAEENMRLGGMKP